jgi:hypothetical protein
MNLLHNIQFVAVAMMRIFIYVNDFENLPSLPCSQWPAGRLKFINPEMVRNISFYNGGLPGKVW